MLRTSEPEWILPFLDMERGDSFFIPTTRPSSLIYTIETKAKKVKMKVRCYAVVYEGMLGVRTWRVG